MRRAHPEAYFAELKSTAKKTSYSVWSDLEVENMARLEFRLRAEGKRFISKELAFSFQNRRLMLSKKSAELNFSELLRPAPSDLERTLLHGDIHVMDADPEAELQLGSDYIFQHLGREDGPVLCPKISYQPRALVRKVLSNRKLKHREYTSRQ